MKGKGSKDDIKISVRYLYLSDRDDYNFKEF